MDNVSQHMTATLDFSNPGGVVPDEYDHRGWCFMPDRAEVDFVISSTGDSWIPDMLVVSGVVVLKDGTDKGEVRRKSIWMWNRDRGCWADMRRPVPRWAVNWVRSVCPVNNVRLDPIHKD